jgi:hypothetical protein
MFRNGQTATDFTRQQHRARRRSLRSSARSPPARRFHRPSPAGAARSRRSTSGRTSRSCSALCAIDGATPWPESRGGRRCWTVSPSPSSACARASCRRRSSRGWHHRAGSGCRCRRAGAAGDDGTKAALGCQAPVASIAHGVQTGGPAGEAIHVILDNYPAHKHPRVLGWLARLRRWALHFTLTSGSWLNAVETSSRRPPAGGSRGSSA